MANLTMEVQPQVDMKSMVAQLNPMTKAFLAGSFSGTCSTVMFQPLDLVKTRQQSAAIPTPSMIGVARGIITTDSIIGLWRGVLPSVCRTVPGVGIYFSSMHYMKSRYSFSSSSSLNSAMIGAIARTIAATTMIPMTVLKTRYECSGFQYRSILRSLFSIFSTEGISGLTRGLLPTLIRDVPFSAIYLASYETLKTMTSNHVFSGLLAGFMASLITQPADVVKTRMQLSGSMTGGFVGTVKGLHMEKGLKAFAVGLAPRVARRTVMAAMAWTVYEGMLSSMALK